MAAKIACPQTPVICLAGDGCFLMNGQELATAMQYDAPVIFIVVNNGMYGTIRMHQERVSGTRERHRAAQPGLRRAGARLRRRGPHRAFAGGLPGAVEAALAAPVATVIEVQTDPEIISPRATLQSLRAQARG